MLSPAVPWYLFSNVPNCITHLSSHQEEDDGWDGEEVRRQSSRCGRRPVCFTYELPLRALQGFWEVIEFCGWIGASEAMINTGSEQVLINNDEEMKNAKAHY